jgi:hypothetical protein
VVRAAAGQLAAKARLNPGGPRLLRHAHLLLASLWQAFSLSLQLSYPALVAILAVDAVFQRLRESGVSTLALAPLDISLGAQIATVPLVVARFAVECPSGLLLRRILVPQLTAVLWGAFVWIALFVVFSPFLHDLSVPAFAIPYQLIERTGAIFDRAPRFPAGQEPLPGAIALSLALAFPVLLVSESTRAVRVLRPSQ